MRRRRVRNGVARKRRGDGAEAAAAAAESGGTASSFIIIYSRTVSPLLDEANRGPRWSAQRAAATRGVVTGTIPFRRVLVSVERQRDEREGGGGEEVDEEEVEDDREERGGAPSSWGHPSQRLCPGGFRRSGSPPWKMARVEEEPHAMRRRYEQGEPYGAPDPYARQSHYHEHENYGIHEGQYDTEERYQSEEGYRGEEEGEAYEMEAPYVREPLDRFPGPDKASTRNEAFSERWRIAPRDDPYYDDPYKHDGYPDVPEPPRLYERGLARRPPMEARDQHSPVQPGFLEADRQEQDDSETATDLLVNFGGYSGPHRRPSSAPNRKQRLAALLTSLGLTLDDLQDLGTFREEELTPGRSLEILRDISNRKLMNVACTVMGSSEAAAAVSAIAAATTATSSRKSATAIVEEKRPKVWDYTHGEKDTHSGCPSPQQKNDYFGRRPPKFPHTCCICNKPLSGIRDWTKHISGRIHQASCEFIKEK
ncbi:unnamed protein product [Lampetra fluviatilis]